jgi:hypothetical protein
MERVCFILTETVDLAPNTGKDNVNILALDVTESLINATESKAFQISRVKPATEMENIHELPHVGVQTFSSKVWR